MSGVVDFSRYCQECGFSAPTHFKILGHTFNGVVRDANPTCHKCDRRMSEHVESGGRLRCQVGEGFSAHKVRLSGDKMPHIGKHPAPHVPIGIYRHYKHSEEEFALYHVFGGSFFATGEGQETHVQYRPLQGGYAAHRTVEDFISMTDTGAKRFTLLRSFEETPGLIPFATGLSGIVSHDMNGSGSLTLYVTGLRELFDYGLDKAYVAKVATTNGYDARQVRSTDSGQDTKFGIQVRVFDYKVRLPAKESSAPASTES